MDFAPARDWESPDMATDVGAHTELKQWLALLWGRCEAGHSAKP